MTHHLKIQYFKCKIKDADKDGFLVKGVKPFVLQ